MKTNLTITSQPTGTVTIDGTVLTFYVSIQTSLSSEYGSDFTIITGNAVFSDDESAEPKTHDNTIRVELRSTGYVGYLENYNDQWYYKTEGNYPPNVGDEIEFEAISNFDNSVITKFILTILGNSKKMFACVF